MPKPCQSIYLNNKKFIDEVEVAVYDTDFRMLYHDALQNDIIKETPEMIERILQKKEIDFYIEDYQGVGIIYTFEGKDYIVTAAAYDGYGYAKREILKETLALLLFSGLTVLIIVGYLLARSALAPIRSIVKEAENITASRINKRLPVKNEKDELGELSLTFNALLDRLESHSIRRRCLSATCRTNCVPLWLHFLPNLILPCRKNEVPNNTKTPSTTRCRIRKE